MNVFTLRLQEEHEQCKDKLSVALETEKQMTSDLTRLLEEEKKRHCDKRSELEQVAR